MLLYEVENGEEIEEILYKGLRVNDALPQNAVVDGSLVMCCSIRYRLTLFKYVVNSIITRIRLKERFP